MDFLFQFIMFNFLVIASVNGDLEDQFLNIAINTRIGDANSGKKCRLIEKLRIFSTIKFSLQKENLTLLRGKIESKIEKISQTHFWPSDKRVYLKKMKTHKQHQFVELNNENYKKSFESAEPFIETLDGSECYQIFIFFSISGKKNSEIRRATSSNMQKAR